MNIMKFKCTKGCDINHLAQLMSVSAWWFSAAERNKCQIKDAFKEPSSLSSSSPPLLIIITVIVLIYNQRHHYYHALHQNEINDKSRIQSILSSSMKQCRDIIHI